MIHVLDFNGNIVDFISLEDNDVIYAKHNRNLNERSETYNLTLLSDSATHFMQKNRVIVQDSNDKYREFIITHIESDDGYTEIEMSASYLEDIAKAKPISPGKYEKMTTSQALDEVLKDTGWQRSEETEYGGIRTTSWTSYQTRYEVLLQLCTTYTMSLDFYIELGSNRVKGRYVSLKEKNPLFKGKEIVKGKDLISMKRIVELDEIRTGLLCIGPEKDDGSRIEVIVTDDEAQEQFGLPERYIWGIYEPESDDGNMTATRLKTLGTTELNKRKVALISYEVTAFDIKKESPHEIVNIGDKVRIKDRDFNPPLYVEAEVIGEEYDPISKDSTYTFGQYKEYNENDLRAEFNKKLSSIQQKLNNNINNSNTIITDRIEEEIERLQRTIHRGETPPTNPEEGDFWYDTTNPKVAVLREFVDGEWRNASAHDVEQIGGMTKEAIIYNEVNGTFIALSVQHAKITNEVYEALNSEYLVDEDIRTWLNNELDGLNNIFNSVRDLLESMTVETATIGKLMDTQGLIVQYRSQIYALNTALLNARQAIGERFKLLQSQYTEEKYNEAMQKVADVIGGTYDAETGQLIADIPSKETLEEMRVTIETAMSDMSADNAKKLQDLQEGITQTNQRITTTNEELSAGIESVTKKVDGMQVGGRNLLLNSANISKAIDVTSSSSLNQYWFANITTAHNNFQIGDEITVSFDVQMERGEYLKVYDSNQHFEYRFGEFVYNNIGSEIVRLSFTKKLISPTKTGNVWNLAFYNNNNGDRFTIDKIKIEKGNIATAWTPAPEDTDKQLSDIKTSVQTQSADIQLIKDGIKLKADSSEVTKIYDNYLTPLQTQVNQQKATLDILPSQIAAKVSQSQYTTDMNNVVGRLNTADSERTQLGNEIRDRVTLNEYNQATKEQEERLKTMETSVSQNGQDILLRAKNEDLIKSKKTLSRVLADLTIDTIDGLSLTYDENGSITSHVVGPNGVKIKGNRVDIQANKEFSVLVQDTNNKVGKNEIINSLNLSQEGLDINVNNIGIFGGDTSSYVQIKNDRIELGGRIKRTWKGQVSNDEIYTRLKDGHLRFRNNVTDSSLYMSQFGISTFIDGEGETGSSGTIQWWDKTYSENNANGITMNSYGGVVALSSDLNRIVLDGGTSTNIESKIGSVFIRPYRDNRPGLNRFNFTLSNSDNAYSTNGYIMYGAGDSNYGYGVGLRMHKNVSEQRIAIVDQNFATGGNTVIESGIGEFNQINRRSGNSYLRFLSDNFFSLGADTKSRIYSDAIYNRTYSFAANVHITTEGTLGRSTSASKYKLAIEKQFNDHKLQYNYSKKILNLEIKTWYDKSESEIYAEEVKNKETLSDDKFIIKRHAGLIAEDVEEVGLAEFVSYGADNEIEGIAYDRLWINLIPIIKEQQKRIKQLEEIINE